jgi:HK97 family phage major capsid protein
VFTPAEAMAFIFVADVAPATVGELHKALEVALGKLGENIKKAQDTAMSAMEQTRQEGTLHKEMADTLKTLGENSVKLQTEVKGLNDKLLAVEQASTKRVAELEAERSRVVKTAGELITESDEFKAWAKEGKGARSGVIKMDRKAILNAPLNNDQPLVDRLRLPGIITAPERRLTIRDLMPNIAIATNLVEFAKELVFTNNAGPQGGSTSPAHGEGQQKNESNITFELASAAVITIAHWLAASRQVLDDVPQLQGYISTRLGYGLKLEEEDELLNGAGTSGELNGLRNQASAYVMGASNDTIIDMLLKLFTQVSLSEYEASAVVLHPTDWMRIQLLKDTTGRYLFSEPHRVEQPSIWGRKVVATQSMTLGQALGGAFDIGAAVYDREQMNVRLADQHANFFIENMFAILVEERLALAVYRPAAFVAGAIPAVGT